MSTDPQAFVPPPIPVPPGLPPDVAAQCGITADDWTRMLVDLLPVGAAWPRDPDTTLVRFWSAVAIEPTRIQGRDCDLLAESYPCGAEELLPDWEQAVGLPNECTELIDWTVAERQALVCAWLAMTGGQSIAYFVWLADLFGYTITIQEHFPFRTGTAHAGCAALTNCPFWWTVTVAGTPRTTPRAGCTRAGEPPCGTGASIIECLFRMFAPAHTTVTFRYPAGTTAGPTRIGAAHAYDA
jgi:uncharacterized protein YmfQ (DUF2313 family)